MIASILLAAALQSEGQTQVDALLAKYRKTKDFTMRAGIDRACHQFDCAESGLYWFTDLDAAKMEAKRLKRPILSLRLLGNLDEEMSCANSRYFRILLYSNPTIAQYMRDNFILHWSSERPVPVVTVDFGDGRVMKRTLTGNSVHYLLDETGQPLDALPGLYAPKAFLSQLEEMKAVYDAWSTGPSDRAARLAGYHRLRLRSAKRSTSEAARRARLQKPSTAWEAAPLAASKMGGEAPLLMKVSFGVNAVVQQPTIWLESAVPSDLTELDPASIALVRAKHPGSEEELQFVLTALRQRLAADTMRNEYELRALIHEQFTGEPVSFESLNKFVYDVVFATPRTDPWLGLLPLDTFTGIPREGVSEGR